MVNIRRTITVPARYMTKGIRRHLLHEARETMTEICTEEYGHIIEISRILEIHSNRITAAQSDIVFDVTLEAKTLKPEAGMTLEGVICNTCPRDGIFVEVEERMRVLAPKRFLKGYTFHEGSYKKGEISLAVGDTVQIKLKGARFMNDRFSAWGVVVDSE